MQPDQCHNCSARTAMLYFDGVYYFLACEQCCRTGHRGMSPEEAVELWNEMGATTFMYGDSLQRERVVKRLPCVPGTMRADCGLDIPVVLAVGGARGKKATGKLKCISYYGAYLEMQGGDLSALPTKESDVSDIPLDLFFKLPLDLVPPRANGKQPIQTLKFVPASISVHKGTVRIGGKFMQVKQGELKMLNALVGYAENRDQVVNG